MHSPGRRGGRSTTGQWPDARQGRRIHGARGTRCTSGLRESHMIVRRGAAVVLCLGLGLAATVMAPATAVEGGPVKGGHVSLRTAQAKDTEPCSVQGTTR